MATTAAQPIDNSSEMIHIFEVEGLGIAPFAHVAECDRGRNHTCCDYCGTSIRYEQIIQDSTGHMFKVGSECVRKTDDSGLISKMKLAEKARKERQKEEKKQAELQAQRDRNGGKTDGELTWERIQAEEAAAQAEMAQRRAANAAAAKEFNAPLLAVMQPYITSHVQYRQSIIDEFNGTLQITEDMPFASCTFMGDIWDTLQSAPHTVLSERQRTVLAEIIAKGNMRAAGKRKRDPFQAEVDAVLWPK